MLLHKTVREGLVPKSKMSERFASFSQGRWEDLLIQSRDSALAAVQAQVKRRRRAVPNCPDIGAERAHIDSIGRAVWLMSRQLRSQRVPWRRGSPFRITQQLESGIVAWCWNVTFESLSDGREPR